MEKVKQEAIAKVLNSNEDGMFTCETQTTIVGDEMVETKVVKQNIGEMSDFTKRIIAREMYADFVANKRSQAFKSEALVQEHSTDTGRML